jgi:trigger factor
VVEHEQEHLLREYADGLAQRGVDPEKAEVDWLALAGEVKPQAEKRVHARLLLDAIAEAQSLTVSEDEFERTIAGIARAEGKNPAAVRAALDEAGKLQTLRAQLRREKALRMLTGEAA